MVPTPLCPNDIVSCPCWKILTNQNSWQFSLAQIRRPRCSILPRTPYCCLISLRSLWLETRWSRHKSPQVLRGVLGYPTVEGGEGDWEEAVLTDVAGRSVAPGSHWSGRGHCMGKKYGTLILIYVYEEADTIHTKWPWLDKNSIPFHSLCSSTSVSYNTIHSSITYHYIFFWRAGPSIKQLSGMEYWNGIPHFHGYCNSSDAQPLSGPLRALSPSRMHESLG